MHTVCVYVLTCCPYDQYLTNCCIVLGIIKCQQNAQWIEEEPYEVMGIIVCGQSFITEAPRKGRENAMLQVNAMHQSITQIHLIIIFTDVLNYFMNILAYQSSLQ